MANKKKRFPFYISISTLIVLILGTCSGLFLWISHHESKMAAMTMADRLFTEINTKTVERYESALESTAMLVKSAARMPSMRIRPTASETTHPAMAVLFEALDAYDFLFSAYVGYEDGGFLQVVALRNKKEIMQLFGAPPEAAYVLRTIAADPSGGLVQKWRFLDTGKQVIGRRNDLDPNYDPRTRPWYIRARSETTAFFTRPYIFSSTRLPGITCAETLSDRSGVVGADITLNRFALSLVRQKLSANGILFLFDNDGRIIAHPERKTSVAEADAPLRFPTGESFDDPRIRSVVSRYKDGIDREMDRTIEMNISGSAFLVRLTPITTAYKFGQILASVAPVSDFTGHIRRMQQRIFFFSGLVLVIFLPLAILVTRKITSSLMRLEIDSLKIQRSDFSESPPFDSNIREIHSLIKAFFLMKTKIRRLLEQQRKLFDDFTKLIAGAIDAKSQYTGGHCARVPIVAQMLAQAACEAKTGPFADFSMETPDQRWEFELAAWLHDCGKVTTPEYVVDKATKLETIYNRIHEIRMRFEVLLRDAEIDYYKQRLADAGDQQLLAEVLERKQRQIESDYSFVAQCNLGGEFMEDEKLGRLKEIGAQTWVRHLDDRIGISQDEAAQKNRQPASSLPVVEHILADKEEHIIPRLQTDPFEGNPYGFNMNVPDKMYNLGEIYNLSVRKGTLSAEDRFKINEHIIQTIIMLNRLEFPEYLKNVSEFAGGHHETMDGTGYPRGLSKEDMSVHARILAVADIFEALTAVDRPYKTPKTLSESLKIMSFMRDDQHIDAELFDLFLKTGIYRTYAEKYMAPEQIDSVDIENYLSAGAKRE